MSWSGRVERAIGALPFPAGRSASRPAYAPTNNTTRRAGGADRSQPGLASRRRFRRSHADRRVVTDVLHDPPPGNRRRRRAGRGGALAADGVDDTSRAAALCRCTKLSPAEASCQRNRSCARACMALADREDRATPAAPAPAPAPAPASSLQPVAVC